MLEIKELTKKYGDFLAVDNLSISLQKGRVLGLLGRNGAGKTTTIKMLLGLRTPTNGSILWDGKSIQQAGVSVGYLPEERGLFSKTKVVDQLRYFGKLEGMTSREVDDAIHYWLNRLEISHYRNKKAGELSKGNQQKIQIIVTLLHNPELIILDEPFSGLDPVNAELLTHILIEEIEKGKTVILSSHRMEQVEAFCQQICILKNGEVVAAGDLNQIKAEYGYRHLMINDHLEIKKWLQNHDVLFEQAQQFLKIRVENEARAIQLLNDLSKDKISIREFKLLEPTLNEIFIERAK
ncbi:ATP-binding cassette domain-containing protein [Bacillus sp. RG28]|uniref:ATP-binding cassette domain-containing protein n=1 Tax=Gottfriedia endophytica TaxID=2820819 RepID=A0A940NEF7_9BACI|nr:ATP-binding cassette domain-containing protein [Gottfriedia endophytica]MBP0723984.1 ATP-binding cassette domain-containing protein [Gottfriedia endophytica]